MFSYKEKDNKIAYKIMHRCHSAKSCLHYFDDAYRVVKRKTITTKKCLGYQLVTCR